MKVVAMLNQKGGVGKTSTCFHLAGALASAGKRVLLVDNDPQASLTQGIYGPELAARIDPDHSTAGVPEAKVGAEPLFLRGTGIERVMLIAGHRALDDWNLPSPWRRPRDDQFALKAFLDEHAFGFDVVLVDCPPNLCMCSWGALIASDLVVVPLQPEDYGAQGVSAVVGAVDRAQRGPRPSIATPNFLITMVRPRLTVHKAFEAKLRGDYGGDVFETSVPLLADFAEAVAVRKPVGLHKPRSRAAAVTAALAAELLDRLHAAPAAAPAPALLVKAGANGKGVSLG